MVSRNGAIVAKVSRMGRGMLVDALLWGYHPQHTCIPEYHFCERGWRFDFAFPARKVAVEIEGGVWIRGAGSHGSGRYDGDCEKYNRAQLEGWCVLRFTYRMLRDDMSMCRAMLDAALNGGRP